MKRKKGIDLKLSRLYLLREYAGLTEERDTSELFSFRKDDASEHADQMELGICTCAGDEDGSQLYIYYSLQSVQVSL